jgi:hypothetical protein
MARKKNVTWKYAKLNGVLNRKYKVSNYGDIVNAKTGETLPQTEMDKKSPINGTDYKSVTIEGRKYRVHRVVCETFHGPSKGDKVIVDHIDEHKDNNKSTNLQWISQSENVRRYVSKHGQVRHTPRTISRTKRLLNSGLTNDAIAQKVGMSDSNVSAIRYGYIHTTVEPLTTDQVELGNV